MTPKQRVLKRWPKAACERTYFMPSGNEGFCVFKTHKAVRYLGTGQTARAAWANALKGMKP